MEGVTHQSLRRSFINHNQAKFYIIPEVISVRMFTLKMKQEMFGASTLVAGTSYTQYDISNATGDNKAQVCATSQIQTKYSLVYVIIIYCIHTHTDTVKQSFTFSFHFAHTQTTKIYKQDEKKLDYLSDSSLWLRVTRPKCSLSSMAFHNIRVHMRVLTCSSVQ